MKYTINKTNFRDFSFYELNKREGRAYFIPFSDKETLEKTDFRKERFSSDLVRVLSGEWEFKYYAHAADLPVTFDTEKTEFDKINVPSTWQRKGYMEPLYLNCPYEFQLTPPAIPDDMNHSKNWSGSYPISHTAYSTMSPRLCIASSKYNSL